MTRLLSISLAFSASLTACTFDCNECLLFDALQRSVELSQDKPLVVPGAPADGSAPELHVSTLRVDTNTATMDSFALLPDDGSFSLPLRGPGGPSAEVLAPQAWSCDHLYAAEVTLEVTFPEGWPGELPPFPAQTLSFVEGAWPSVDDAPVACFGDWCVEVYLH